MKNHRHQILKKPLKVRINEIWWDKTHLSIEPSLLKSLILNDGYIEYLDNMTNRTIFFTGEEIRDNKNLEYDKNTNLYRFPIC